MPSRIRIAPTIISGARSSVVTLLVVTVAHLVRHRSVSRTSRSLVSSRSTLPHDSCVICRYSRNREPVPDLLAHVRRVTTRSPVEKSMLAIANTAMYSEPRTT